MFRGTPVCLGSSQTKGTPGAAQPWGGDSPASPHLKAWLHFQMTDNPSAPHPMSPLNGELLPPALGSLFIARAGSEPISKLEHLSSETLSSPHQ